MNDLILSQMRQRLEILYQMVNELEEGGGGSGGDSYTKAQTDALLNLKADKSSTYTKSEVNTIISTKVSMDDVYGTGKVIPDNSDLNDYRTPGKYGVSSSAHAATISNIPESGSGFTLLVMGLNDATSYVRQTYIKSNRPGYYYVRHYTSGSWSNWNKFEGTEVT